MKAIQLCLCLAIAAPALCDEPIKRDELEAFHRERQEKKLPPRQPILYFGNRMQVGHVGLIPAGLFDREFNRFYDVVISQVLDNGVIADITIFEMQRQVHGDGAQARVGGIAPKRIDDVTVAIRGVDTTNLVDGKHVKLPGAYEVRETKRFETAVGFTTLFVLEPTELPPLPAQELAVEEKPKLRKWSDDSGSFSIEADFIGFEDSKVILKKADGATIRVAQHRLSKADQIFFRDELKKRKQK